MIKKIWIDGYEANMAQRLGSGQVAYQLLKNIRQLDKKNSYTVLLPNIPLPDMPEETENFRYKVLKPRKLWTRFALPFALYTAKERADVIFSPTHYGPWLSPIKNVITIFDLANLHFPDMYPKGDLYKLNNWTKHSVNKAAHIITISQFSKKDIVKQYSVNKKNITVAYPGYNSEIYKPIKDRGRIQEILEKYKIFGEYILFIGTVQPRKNLIKLIEAVAKIENLKLVVVGKTIGQGRQGWMFEKTLNKPTELGIEDRVIFTGFVADKDIGQLMNGALAFCLPSLWEGFGIPVVDAMACGVPVLVSNVSSLPEVVGNAGLTFDPNSVEQIEQAIRAVYGDKKLRASLSKKGLVRARKFSWSKMARQVIKVLENT